VRHKRPISVFVLVVSLVFGIDAFSFAIDWPQRIHQYLTRDALQAIVIDLALPSSNHIEGRFSDADISWIIQWNVATDEDQGLEHSEKHFDADKLTESSKRIIQWREEIIRALIHETFLLADGASRDAAKTRVLVAQTYLGEALHTLQDFYAHSNFVERGDLHGPILAKWGKETLKRDPNSECNESNPGSSPLSTGWFKTPLISDHCDDAPPNRCNHGIFSDICGINKDFFGQTNFLHANSFAYEATLAFTRGILLDVLSESQKDKALLDKYGSRGAQYAGIAAVCEFMGVPDAFNVCFDDILIVDIPFTDSALETCIEAKAAQEGWGLASEVTSLHCTNMGISNLSGIEYLTNITWLDLFQNNISNIEPLQHLTKLGVLQVFQNQISNIGPLSVLMELEALEANDNNITSIAPLSGHQKFWWLTVANNPISDIGPIQNYTKLRVLNLAGTSVSDLSTLSAPNLNTITNLSIDNLSVTDISSLAGMVNMLVLGASGNNISDISPLINMPQLERLHLENNKIESTGVEPLLGLPSLRYLLLQENRIFDAEPLTGLGQLVELFLWSQEWPPGLDCTQQRAIADALPSTSVFVDDFWDDPNDAPDHGPVACNPNIVDIPFADAALEACIESRAVDQGWVKASEFEGVECRNMGISKLDGVEWLFNLHGLDVVTNQIADLSPLRDHQVIFNLAISENQVSDLSKPGVVRYQTQPDQ